MPPASGEIVKVVLTVMFVSETGIFRLNSATTKAAVQGYPYKAASICFTVMSACLCCALALFHLVATYTSKLYLPIAQCQISHQGLCCDAESAGV